MSANITNSSMTRMNHTLGYLSGMALVVQSIVYKKGYRFSLRSQAGMDHSLEIEVDTVDPINDKRILVTHQFQIPPYMVNNFGTGTGTHCASVEQMQDWVFDKVRKVEQHEAAEFMRFGNIRPYVPEHGEGSHPYNIRRMP